MFELYMLGSDIAKRCRQSHRQILVRRMMLRIWTAKRHAIENAIAQLWLRRCPYRDIGARRRQTNGRKSQISFLKPIVRRKNLLTTSHDSRAVLDGRREENRLVSFESLNCCATI